MKSIYVGNPDFRTTEEELRKIFGGYGQVDRAEIVLDRDSGQPRGFAFVEMTNDVEGEKAIAGLNGSLMEERTLYVNEARPMREH
jgi:RNA recognition motif-containing protein